jgi:hypothetical protein
MISGVLAALLTIMTIPVSILNVQAETLEQSEYVTIVVKDEQGLLLSGATVTYSISEKPEGVNNFETISDSVTTDSYGIAKILSSEEFCEDLVLTAVISKEGYRTDSTTIKELEITSEDQEFQVELIEEIILDIEGVEITTLTSEYNGEYQELVAVSVTTPDVLIEYSTDGSNWIDDIPQEKNAGSYSVYIRITKEGYQTYLSEEKTAIITKRDINGIDILAKTFNYVEGTSQELVELVGMFEEDDEVTWFVNDEAMEDVTIPKKLAVGEYSVKLVVNRGDNYNEYSKTVTSTILNAKLDLAGLIVTGFDSIYDEEAHDAVSIQNAGDYTLMYQLDDGNQIVDEDAWSTDIPQVKDAGSYIVWVKATKVYYDDEDVTVIPAENASAPYNVYIAKAQQTFSYENYTGAETDIEITQPEMQNGKNLDFRAIDTEQKAKGEITYSVEYNPGDDEIASIDTQGVLTVNGAGTVTVKAVLSGDDNYEACMIEHVLYVSGKSDSGAWLSVENTTVEYVLGNTNGIPTNMVTQKQSKDTGMITYSIENHTTLGLNVNQEGIVSITNYAQVISAIESADGSLNVTVKANKEEVRKDERITYPSDEIVYTLVIKMAEVSPSSYKIFSIENFEELTDANGTNGWYNTALLIQPIDGYSIIRAEKLTEEFPLFEESVTFGETVGNDVFDQGEDIERSVYLMNNATGEITTKIILPVEKLDTAAPNDLAIIFPEKEEIDSVKHYGESVTVTFVAYDETSGVDYFDWIYTRESGASESILETDEGRVTATLDTTDESGKKYIGTLTLPKNEVEQLRGNIQIKAIDAAGVESISCTDEGVFVIDTIAPNLTVEYKLQNNEGTTQVVGERHYFSNDVEFIFKVTEANFYGSDVNVMVSKNGEDPEEQSVSWSKTDITDQYMASIILSEDADYVVSMTYQDRAGNTMNEYSSETIVVDKTIPVIEFDYMDFTDDSTPQSATITITEHNFRAEDLSLEVEAKNIIGEDVRVNDLQQYLRNCEWTGGGDVHTATIDSQFVDGIYALTFTYQDLAMNAALEVSTDCFVVDRTAPEIEDMSISYSTPLIETILSKITLGFYNPNVIVTFTAHDSVSGVKLFTWSYEKEAGASDSNVAQYMEESVEAVQDSMDLSKYTASVTLSKNTVEQIRGSVAFTVTDYCNNTSDKLTDSDYVLVVDTVAPTMKVEYTAPDRSFNGKNYYKKNLTATFIITEANFFEEDVQVKLKKNDGTAESVTPTWMDTTTDVHVGRVEIEATTNHANDGDYVFQVEYTDRSNNEMVSYTSGVMVIDTIKPVIDVKYENTNPINEMQDGERHQRKYFSSTQTATITITEHNFHATDVNYKIVAKDVAGNSLNVSSLYSTSSWRKNGDENVLTITYPGDANYTFDIEYTDLARMKADAYATDYFTVDTSKPTNLSVTYSNSVLDTVLSAITFGFYNAKATVTISATDHISGIHSMKYSYVNASGVSGVNAQLVNATIDASAITNSNGGAVGTATFTIPRSTLASNSQFNGTINFMASDKVNNESDYLRDTKRIVVDSIAPTASVQYSTPVQTVDGVAYYDGDVTATVTVYEANFYSEDVQITATRDGVATSVQASWSDSSTDVHVGSFTLSGDGDYTVGITYSDKSTNAMQAYTSEQMTIDTEIEQAVITVNGEDADGKAFKDEVVPAVNFDDTNFESCEIKMFRTSLEDKNVDVTEEFITGHIYLTETGGSGEFDTFDKLAENDGIYTITTELTDKAGHTVENSITFTVNRFGSVYEYNDLLISLISDGGAYVQSVEEDLVITEYNADRLLSDSLNIEILRDGKPLDRSEYDVTPDIDENVSTGSSGWYQYSYTIAKESFAVDGVYKIAVSSKDATGNTPENSNYEDKVILFRVDSTAPEITSILGLEDAVVNATEQTVKYTIYDTIGLESIFVYVDGEKIDQITDFSTDANNYIGEHVLQESSKAQNVRLVVTDKAGNVTDTDAEDFTSSYVFHDAVTVSTNALVRWYANKALFFGSICGGVIAVVGGTVGTTLLFRKRREMLPA